VEFKNINQANLEACELVAYHSIGDRYRIGIRRVLFGYRVFADKIGDGWYLVDYCCAADSTYLMHTFFALVTALKGVDEQMQPYHVEKLFPKQQYKPMRNDVTCFIALHRLANEYGCFRDNPLNEVFEAHLIDGDLKTKAFMNASLSQIFPAN
jgi:hypothetical protein